MNYRNLNMVTNINKVNFLGIQETMTGNINQLTIQSFWNSSSFNFVCKNSIGKSGGFLVVWDTSCFSLIDSSEGNYFLALIGNWCNIESSCLIIVVYASQDYREKKKLWKDLSQLITFHSTFSILLGNFNDVRFESERIGTNFIQEGLPNLMILSLSRAFVIFLWEGNGSLE